MTNFNTVSVEFIGKDQDWQEESTTYWFKLDGEQHGTDSKFDGDVFGIVECGAGEPQFVDSDGSPVFGIYDEPAIRRALDYAVTDSMRAQ